LTRDSSRSDIQNNRIVLLGVVPRFHIDQFITFFCQNQRGRYLPVCLPKNSTQFHDHTEISRNSFNAMLSIQRMDQTGEVAHIILKSGWGELDISFEYRRVYIPTFNQLVDILRREEVFVSRSIAFKGKDRFINL